MRIVTSFLRDLRSHPIAAIVGLVIGILVGWCAGCGHRPDVRVGTAAVVDCTVGAAAQNADELGPVLEQVIRDTTAPDGVVDWTRVRGAAEALGWDVAQCGLAAAVTRLLAPADPSVAVRSLAVTPQPSEASVREGWERLRAVDLGGRRYRVNGGVL
jgi:hypothetical protein